MFPTDSTIRKSTGIPPSKHNPDNTPIPPNRQAHIHHTSTNHQVNPTHTHTPTPYYHYFPLFHYLRIPHHTSTSRILVYHLSVHTPLSSTLDTLLLPLHRTFQCPPQCHTHQMIYNALPPPYPSRVTNGDHVIQHRTFPNIFKSLLTLIPYLHHRYIHILL